MPTWPELARPPTVIRVWGLGGEGRKKSVFSLGRRSTAQDTENGPRGDLVPLHHSLTGGGRRERSRHWVLKADTFMTRALSLWTTVGTNACCDDDVHCHGKEQQKTEGASPGFFGFLPPRCCLPSLGVLASLWRRRAWVQRERGSVSF